jgi:hypothetical protein
MTDTERVYPDPVETQQCEAMPKGKKSAAGRDMAPNDGFCAFPKDNVALVKFSVR